MAGSGADAGSEGTIEIGPKSILWCNALRLLHLHSLAHKMSRLVVSLIALYQRHLSPRKGWCCAYRRLTGEESCSQYAKRVIEDAGLFAALSRIRVRLRGCGRAYQMLSEQSEAKKNRLRSSDIEGAKKDVAAETCCAGCSLLSWLKHA